MNQKKEKNPLHEKGRLGKDGPVGKSCEKRKDYGYLAPDWMPIAPQALNSESRTSSFHALGALASGTASTENSQGLLALWSINKVIVGVKERAGTYMHSQWLHGRAGSQRHQEELQPNISAAWVADVQYRRCTNG